MSASSDTVAQRKHELDLATANYDRIGRERAKAADEHYRVMKFDQGKRLDELIEFDSNAKANVYVARMKWLTACSEAQDYDNVFEELKHTRWWTCKFDEMLRRYYDIMKQITTVESFADFYRKELRYVFNAFQWDHTRTCGELGCRERARLLACKECHRFYHTSHRCKKHDNADGETYGYDAYGRTMTRPQMCRQCETVIFDVEGLKLPTA
jgi:hypothetical protein